MTSPAAVLRAVVDGSLESSSTTALVLARVWGQEAGEQSMAALRVRSASRRRASVRAALRALAMQPTGAEERPPAHQLCSLVDAWLARMVQAGTKADGVIPPEGWQERLPKACRDIIISPRSMGNEVGALTSRLSFALGDAWTFPLTATAREEWSCEDAPQPAATQEKRPPLWPNELHRVLVSEYKSFATDAYSRCLDAAIVGRNSRGYGGGVRRGVLLTMGGDPPSGPPPP